MVTAVYEIINHAAFYVKYSFDLLILIAIFSGMWTGCGFWLRYLISNFRKVEGVDWFGWVSFLLYVLAVTTYFVSVRAGELLELFVFLVILIVALPIALIWDILSSIFLAAQFSFLTISSFVLHSLLVSYFWVYPLFPASKRFSRFSLSLLLLLCSKVFVVRRPRYCRTTLGSGCVSGCKRLLESKLCPSCDSLINSSPLLVGARWIFTRPVEYHLHHTARDLQISA
jgi:hypothetical protein